MASTLLLNTPTVPALDSRSSSTSTSATSKHCWPCHTSISTSSTLEMAGMKLKMTTAFHPQTDGQSEVVNRTIAMYLWCITGDRSWAWLVQAQQHA